MICQTSNEKDDSVLVFHTSSKYQLSSFNFQKVLQSIKISTLTWFDDWRAWPYHTSTIMTSYYSTKSNNFTLCIIFHPASRFFYSISFFLDINRNSTNKITNFVKWDFVSIIRPRFVQKYIQMKLPFDNKNVLPPSQDKRLTSFLGRPKISESFPFLIFSLTFLSTLLILLLYSLSILLTKPCFLKSRAENFLLTSPLPHKKIVIQKSLTWKFVTFV